MWGRAGFQAQPQPGLASLELLLLQREKLGWKRAKDCQGREEIPGGGEEKEGKKRKMEEKGRKGRKREKKGGKKEGIRMKKEEKAARGDPSGLENPEGRWELLVSMDLGDFGSP